jgi:hypothetical protein
VDSDLDLCALFPVLAKDPFELAYEVRREIHKHLDIALDVVICDESRFADRGREHWTIEHAIQVEGIRI